MRIKINIKTVVVGQATGSNMTSWICRQDKVQRYFSVRSMKESKISIFLSTIMCVLVGTLALLCGLAAFAYFDQVFLVTAVSC